LNIIQTLIISKFDLTNLLVLALDSDLNGNPVLEDKFSKLMQPEKGKTSPVAYLLNAKTQKTTYTRGFEGI